MPTFHSDVLLGACLGGAYLVWRSQYPKLDWLADQLPGGHILNGDRS